MNPFLRGCLGLFAVAVVFVPAATVSGDENTLTEAERDGGWLLLFDGATTAGWMTPRGEPLPARHVQEGSLNPHPCDYMLVHEKVWENFQLSLDFKISPKCNSGVFIRTFPLTPRPEKDVGYNGIEVAIDDTTTNGFHDSGAIYDLVAPARNAMKPAGAWNHLVVTCDRNLIIVELNGEAVNRMDLDEWADPNRRPDGSEHKFDVAYKGHPRKGYIGLQDHGSDCWYRNIKLRPLPDTPGDAAPPPGAGASGIPTHGRTYTIAGLPQSDYTMDATYEHGTLTPLSCAGTAAYLIKPNGPADPERRWIWVSNLFLALNDKDCGPVMQRFYVEHALERGFHVAGVDVGASCGSPAGAEVYEAFYQMVVKEFGLNARARMIGQSNGGLITYGYAFRYPQHVDRVLGIFPATDFTSWPGLDKICGAFAPAGLAYGLDEAEMRTRIAEFNPIDNVAPLVEAGVRAYHIHGTVDTVVPLEPNSGEFSRRYEALGGDIQVEVVENGNHGSPIPAFFESRNALEFLLE